MATDWPYTDGFGVEATATAVAAGLTVCVVVPVLAVKLASPL
jgi:hypothetical protein